MKESILIIFLYLLLTSCTSMQEAGKVMRNEKVNTTDEFLVKKKEPLVLPPDYNKMPQPDSMEQREAGEKQKIKNILKGPDEEKSDTNKSSSVEQSILNKIRK
tara:strand:- start:104 stop:412 length:309 start_codon:yes stop_codon:yes gene_type:complete